MTRRNFVYSVTVIAFAALLVVLAVVWSARTVDQPVEVRAFSRPEARTANVRTATAGTVKNAPTATTVDELAVWQRAVWQAAVWENATATTTTSEPEGRGDVGPPPAAAENPNGDYDVEAIIRETWAGTGLEEWALGIAWRESRYQPDVVSGEGALGLFQLLGHDDLIAEAAAILGRAPDWSDPWVNSTAAMLLATRSGTCHWQAPDYCS